MSQLNPTQLQTHLLSFYDDLVEFNDHCSFLCDAMSSLFTEYRDSEPDKHTIMGARRQCYGLKIKAEALVREMETIRQSCRSSDRITPFRPQLIDLLEAGHDLNFYPYPTSNRYRMWFK